MSGLSFVNDELNGILLDDVQLLLGQLEENRQDLAEIQLHLLLLPHCEVLESARDQASKAF